MPLRSFRMGDELERSLDGTTPEERRRLDDLFSMTYEELRRLASSVKRGDPSATLSPTALVNEAWLKLASSPRLGATSRLHFKRIAARAMRQVLIEAARRRNADKRGGAKMTVTFDESVDTPASCGEDLLLLDTALEELARLQPRQAMMVECRFFCGVRYRGNGSPAGGVGGNHFPRLEGGESMAGSGAAPREGIGYTEFVANFPMPRVLRIQRPNANA